MSAFTINLQIEDGFASHVDEALLRGAAEAALHTAEAGPPAALSIIITDTQTVRQLNAQYLDNDAPTDVLSFPATDYPSEPGEPPYLGDVLIALPVAEQQATEVGHSTQDELHLLAVHGILHLLDYDHATLDAQAEMWALQAMALDTLHKATR